MGPKQSTMDLATDRATETVYFHTEQLVDGKLQMVPTGTMEMPVKYVNDFKFFKIEGCSDQDKNDVYFWCRNTFFNRQTFDWLVGLLDPKTREATWDTIPTYEYKNMEQTIKFCLKDRNPNASTALITKYAHDPEPEIEDDQETGKTDTKDEKDKKTDDQTDPPIKEDKTTVPRVCCDRVLDPEEWAAKHYIMWHPVMTYYWSKFDKFAEGKKGTELAKLMVTPERYEQLMSDPLARKIIEYAGTYRDKWHEYENLHDLE